MLISSLGLPLALSSTASAAPPTIEQCLVASDRSLELETQEKLLPTRDALRICASLGCPQEVRDECARRIELVEQNIPGVFCEVRDETGSLLRDALVTIDGRVPAVASQELIELEPGSHTLTAEAPGMLPLTQSVTVKPREKNRLVRFLLDSAQSRKAKDGLARQQVAALVTGGIGVVSLATASVFAVIALNRRADARELCPGTTCTSSDGAERWQSAWQAGNFATGFAVSSVVALGTAAGLWFSFEQRDTSIAFGPAQVQLKARF